jgi:hypothetical protein
MIIQIISYVLHASFVVNLHAHMHVETMKVRPL